MQGTIPKMTHNVQRNALIRAEQVLLGSLLVVPSLFKDLNRQRITTDFFFCDAHKAIFELAKQEEIKNRYFKDTLRHKKVTFARDFALKFIEATKLSRPEALKYFKYLTGRATTDIPKLKQYIKLLRAEKANNYEGWQIKK